MSRFSDDFAVASPDLLYEMGESVTRYPLGVEANAVTVTGLFAERTANQLAGRGDDNSRSATLEVAASVATDPRDTWLINSEVWQTTSVNGASAAMKIVELRRNERQRTRPTGTR